MTETTDFEPRHKDDFDQVYDLEDPRPYFRGLRPTHYRMPGVLAGFLLAAHRTLVETRAGDGVLRFVDFACGYGTIGALVRHHLEMRDLYSHYAGEWRLTDGRANWRSDRAMFGERRRDGPAFEIAGVDIAGTALEYADALGFIDAAFAENVVTRAPGAGLQAFLERADLVVESGSAGALLPQAVARMLAATQAEPRPWFLYCPRPDVDWAPLDEIWARSGYLAEPCNRRPVRYRKPLGDFEREEMLRLAESFGHERASALGDDYLLVDLMLARPRSDRDRPSIERLREIGDGCFE